MLYHRRSVTSHQSMRTTSQTSGQLVKCLALFSLKYIKMSLINTIVLTKLQLFVHIYMPLRQLKIFKSKINGKGYCFVDMIFRSSGAKNVPIGYSMMISFFRKQFLVIKLLRFLQQVGPNILALDTIRFDDWFQVIL